jgi:hypothetical protein
MVTHYCITTQFLPELLPGSGIGQLLIESLGSMPLMYEFQGRLILLIFLPPE